MIELKYQLIRFIRKLFIDSMSIIEKSFNESQDSNGTGIVCGEAQSG